MVLPDLVMMTKAAYLMGLVRGFKAMVLNFTYVFFYYTNPLYVYTSCIETSYIET
jgi:hypothetical protein